MWICIFGARSVLGESVGASSSDFVHVIATRLGIGIYDEAWFDYRLSLFESITLPSMMAQTSRDFTLLLGVDKAMPPTARRRLDAIAARADNVALTEVELKSDFKRAVTTWSTKRAAEAGAECVLTSRLDDDDALHAGAMERLHGEIADCMSDGNRFGVFSFNMGTMWIPSERRGYTRYHDSIGIGLSILEPVGECKTVYAHPHRNIKQRVTPRGAYVRSIEGAHPWWLYSAHSISDSDTGNRERHDRIINHKYGYHVDDDMLANFGLDVGMINELGLISEPRTKAPTKFLSLRAVDLEKKIKRLRDESRGRPSTLTRWRIARLQRKRRAAGSGIVQL